MRAGGQVGVRACMHACMHLCVSDIDYMMYAGIKCMPSHTCNDMCSYFNICLAVPLIGFVFWCIPSTAWLYCWKHCKVAPCASTSPCSVSK